MAVFNEMSNGNALQAGDLVLRQNKISREKLPRCRLSVLLRPQAGPVLWESE
jgi:hypothetical protein